MAAPRSVILHAGTGWAEALRDRRHAFFTRLEERLTAEGIPLHLVEADSRQARLLLADEAAFHIMVADRPAYGPRLMHALPAHLWGFWYLDEIGTGWNSSIRFARFHADEVDADKAAYFFNGVTGHMLRENVSKQPQAQRALMPLEPAAAVVFCQEADVPGACYLSTAEMIGTTAQRAGAAMVYVKPHPQAGRQARRDLLALCNGLGNVAVSEASVHDLVAASAVVVTQNSSAGFEALMQRKPVVTCAKSDYWHATLTAKSPGDLREALSFGPEAMADFPFDRYLFWFLDRQCLEPAKDGFPARAWARIRDKGLF